VSPQISSCELFGGEQSAVGMQAGDQSFSRFMVVTIFLYLFLSSFKVGTEQSVNAIVLPVGIFSPGVTVPE
jgi:hypothetical protein